jgi:predicted nucleotide-binding protein (sugar kinase/HSP70/actin superfamily)
MEDIHNALTVLAQEPAAAEAVFRKQWQRVLDCFEEWRPRDLDRTLRSIARELAQIKLRYPLKDARKVALMGEIFVRRDHYSCAELMKRLHERDIVVKRSHFFEWLKYTDTIIKAGIYEPTFSLQQRLQFEAKYLLQHHYEKKIKKILAQSGLYEYEVADIKKIFEFGRHFFDVRFRGESMLVVGGFFKEMFHSFHGLIAVGPFACMPTRVIEAVLSAEATMGVMRRLHGRNGHQLPELGHDASLPFLPLELDGNPLPQILEARIEAFCLQIDRMHRLLTGPVHQNPRSATSGGAAEVLESTPTSADDVQPSA